MGLLNDIRENHLNAKKLSKLSPDTIRVAIEACNCPKDKLCDICKNLLDFYKWKTKENKKYADSAIEWIMHQCCLIFFGPKYKEMGFHFSRDIYTLKEVVELYEEYKRGLNK